MLRHINESLCLHPEPVWKPLYRTGEIIQVGECDKYMVRVPGSRRITVRNHHFLRKFLPLGEKMTEQLLKLPLSEENYNTSNQLNNVPPVQPLLRFQKHLLIFLNLLKW